MNEPFFRQLSEEWDLSLVRLAMYSDIYCRSAKLKEKSLSLLTKGIEAAIAADMYVIADWHILKDSNPLMHVEEAAEFFRTISSQYATLPQHPLRDLDFFRHMWVNIANRLGRVKG